MEVRSKKIEPEVPAFEPFEMTLKFEAEEEVQQFYFLFNYVPITESCKLLPDEAVRDHIHKYVASPDVLFNDLRDELRSRIKS